MQLAPFFWNRCKLARHGGHHTFTLPSCASFSHFFLIMALQNHKELHEILNVAVWRARILSRWPGAICVSALGRKRSALLWKVRCAAIHSSAKGWWRCRCAGRANGWAERRFRGTSGLADVQGAAAAKELRQNHPNLILTFGPELLAAGHDAAPAEGAGHRGLARQLA